MDPEMPDVPNAPEGMGWWVSALVLLAWLADKAWPKVKEWWQAKETAKESDAKLDAKRAAAESKLRHDSQDHVDDRWKRFADTLQAQVETLLKNQANLIQNQTEVVENQAKQEQTMKKLQLAYEECAKREVIHLAQIKELTDRVAKLERQVPQ